MKKFYLILLLVIVLSSVSRAQEYRTGIGLRAGVPYGLTVKHFLTESNALEGILASRWGGFIITGLYEKEHWTGEYPGLNWYWGFGAHLGFWSVGSNPRVGETYSGAVIGADAILGIEYTFDEIPLNLSFDLLPTVNLVGYSGWGGINGALSVRYVF